MSNLVRSRPSSRQSSHDNEFIKGTEPIQYAIRRVKSEDVTWSKLRPDSHSLNGNNNDDVDSFVDNSGGQRSVFAAVADMNAAAPISRYNMPPMYPRTSNSASAESHNPNSGDNNASSSYMPEFTTGGRFKEPSFQTKPTSRLSNFFRRRRSIASKAEGTAAISTGDIYMQGYLSKQGSWRKNWKHRYFILRIDEPALVYCDSEENREVLGWVPITKDTTIMDVSSATSTWAFEVASPQRALLLEAPSPAVFKQWIDAIQDTIDLVTSQQDNEDEAFAPVRYSPDVRLSDENLLSARSTNTAYSASSATDDIANVYDLRVELHVDACGKDRMAYYVLLEGVVQHARGGDGGASAVHKLAQTDVFRCVDAAASVGQCRHAFTVLLPIHSDKHSTVRFSLFRAPHADDVHFGKAPYAVATVDMSTFLPQAIAATGCDLPLHPAKKEHRTLTVNHNSATGRTPSSRDHGTDDWEYSLHISAFAPDKRVVVGVPETSAVTAHRKYIVPTGGAACGVVVVEVIAVPKSTFAMPIAYLTFLVDDLSARLDVLRRTVDQRKLGPIEAHYEALQADARAHIAFLTQESKGKAHFKRSTFKKSKEWAMVATNMHMQTMQVYNGLDLIHTYTTITMGAAAAHTKGFSGGGAFRLKETLHDVLNEANRLRKPKSKEQDPLRTFDLFHIPVGLLSSASANPNSPNKSYDPVSVAQKAWFELEIRYHGLCVQVLSATAAQIAAMLELAAKGSVHHAMMWEVVMRNNLLMDFESLLSTQGNEGGMLEDFRVACKWLESVVFTFEVSPSVTEAVSYRVGRGTNALLNVVVRVPVTFGEHLPSDLATAKKSFRVLAVLFTQGVNEMQSLAHAMHSASTAIQDEINHESFERLGHYFVRFKKIKFAHLPRPRDGYGSPFQPNVSELETMWTQITASIAHQPMHKKNVRLLMATSEFCRRLGGGRATCCKSGKDRTAMSVTLEQARLLVQDFKALNLKHVIETMRLCGVRRDNVFKNIQSHTYAFNELQRKLLPECYKPPVGTYKKGST
ncbi:hypothetical protein DYB31_005644 [Aphanomyces astaci]|uniref:PH domain-containing protein n=3 Tax=Aphanomyces astaci TaxID=112090 RepID=A0A397F7D0_APHAT|nr:hypothetical protein DYB31_005644 [Aphanomyces astaci]